jgi:Rps23 Pro-64 3,4-dihydroxylase Tpa1-like proline 4-hydroxylase
MSLRIDVEAHEDYLVYEPLLSAAELRGLLASVRRHERQFEHSTVLRDGMHEVAVDRRRSRVLFELDAFDDLLLQRIAPLVADAAERLGQAPFGDGLKIEMQLTASNDGEFFTPHTDSGSVTSRALSYVYYFFQQPQKFSGGELRLFRTDDSLLVRPRCNSLVFFRSSQWHEVVRVRVASGQFRHSRFTVNGWVHR